MAEVAPRWIVVNNWDRFQHYRDRHPLWIKLYPALLDDEAYQALPGGCRLLLIELWMIYALMDGQVLDSTPTLTRRRGERTLRAQLDRLSDAGFIRFVASKPLAQRQREKKKGNGPVPFAVDIPRLRQLDG